jgi:serine/threonine protein kinase
MYQYCERCERETFSGNLWCQDPDCPAENSYSLLGYGEYLGDLKVAKLIHVWRTAAMYEAYRNDEKVLLKVAHPGDEYAERLRQETIAMRSLTPSLTGLGAFLRSFLPKTRSLYPIPISPYPSRSKQPYGEISFQGEPRVYAVYQHASGKILSDILLETPQIWHTHAAWMISTIGNSLRPLVRSRKCHLSITPEIILVDTDDEGYFRPMLLDLGFLLDVNESNEYYNWSKLCEPAYTAPEILIPSKNGTHTLAADVYSLGMIYFEMLAGRPAFRNIILRDEQLRDEVTQGRKPLSIDRPELQQAGVTTILDRAVAPTGRYDDVTQFSKDLKKVYSSPPAEKRKIPGRLWAVLILAAIFAIALAVIASATLIQVLTNAS